MGIDGALGTLEVGTLADAAMFSGTDVDVSEVRPE
jgi:hypothetical protein